MNILSVIQRMIAPVSRRVRLMVGKAVVELVDDSLKMQGLQVTILSGEVKDQVERFQQYGLTSHPLPGAEAVFLAVGGNRDHGVVTNVDDRRHRPLGLAAGEVALYTDEGVMVWFKRGGEVHLSGMDPGDAVGLASLIDQRFVDLTTFLTTNKTWLTAHVHPTGVGPSGPSVPAPTSPPSLDTVASEKVMTG